MDENANHNSPEDIKQTRAREINQPGQKDVASYVFSSPRNIGGEVKPCLRVSFDNDGDEDLNKRVKEVVLHCRETWDLENPSLLLSLQGSHDLHSHQLGLGKTIEEGVLGAAKKLGAWIITDETQKSLSKIVGKGVRNYLLATKYNTTRKEINAFMVGLRSNFISKHEGKGYENEYLHHYTHYVLLEGNANSETVNKFRKKLENAITGWRDTFPPLSSGADTDGCCTTPIVRIVMGKDSETKEGHRNGTGKDSETKRTEEKGHPRIVIRMQEEGQTEDDFKPSEESLLKRIEETALLEWAEPVKNIRARCVQFVIQAIRWHRWDLFEEELREGHRITHKTISDNMKEFIKEALLEGQYDFITHFLKAGASLGCLKETIYSTINSTKGGEIFEHLIKKAIPKNMEHIYNAKDKVEQEVIKEVLINIFATYVMKKNTHDKHQKQFDSCWKRDLFLYAVLYDHQPLADICWGDGKNQLGFALLASVLLKKLSTVAETEATHELSNKLLTQSIKWEKRAYDVLSECSKMDEHTTSLLLTRNQDYWNREKANENDQRPLSHAFEGTTLLTMAESFRMMKFTEHTACQTTLSTIWKGEFLRGKKTSWIFVCIFCPLLLCTLTSFRRSSSRIYPLLSKKNKVQFPCDLSIFYRFYTAPMTKFLCYTVAYVVFLAIFSFFLLTQLDETFPGIWEWIIWAWQISCLFEELRQLFRRKGSLGNKVCTYFEVAWNWYDLVISLLFIACACLRFLLPEFGGDFRWARAAYSIMLVICFLRFMQNFYASKALGPKIIMIQKMMLDMFLFLLVLALFILGFGIAYHANMFPKAPLDVSILVNIFYYPYFQMYGELFLDNLQVSGDGDGACSRNETIWREDPSKRCPEDNKIVVYILLSVFLILTNVLLLNLLIAMFSYTFQLVQQKSQTLWKFYRVRLVHEFADRPTLVPPFIFLNHLYRGLVKCYNLTKETCSTGKSLSSETKKKMDEVKKICDCFEKLAVRNYFTQNSQLHVNFRQDLGKEHQKSTDGSNNQFEARPGQHPCDQQETGTDSDN